MNFVRLEELGGEVEGGERWREDWGTAEFEFLHERSFIGRLLGFFFFFFSRFLFYIFYLVSRNGLADEQCADVLHQVAFFIIIIFARQSLAFRIESWILVICFGEGGRFPVCVVFRVLCPVSCVLLGLFPFYSCFFVMMVGDVGYVYR